MPVRTTLNASEPTVFDRACRPGKLRVRCANLQRSMHALLGVRFFIRSPLRCDATIPSRTLEPVWATAVTSCDFYMLSSVLSQVQGAACCIVGSTFSRRRCRPRRCCRRRARRTCAMRRSAACRCAMHGARFQNDFHTARAVHALWAKLSYTLTLEWFTIHAHRPATL